MQPLKHATFRQLAAFHAVARFGSVSRAAEEMHLTQPAVSSQLSILEQSAGTQLLKRTGRGIKLTEAGELLATYAERILSLWREAGEEMAAQCGEISGTLRVGAVTTAEYLLPPLLLEFVREHPKVKVKLEVGNRSQIVERLAGQDVDLAIMGRPPAELKTVSAAFAKHPMAFVASPSHPLMTARKLDLTGLGDTPLLARERGSGTRTTLEQLYKDAGQPLVIGSELSSNEAIKQMCAAGFGVAFLSLHACVLELEAGLLAPLPMVDSPVERDWHVMHLAARQLPHVATAFEQYLLEHGQAWINTRLQDVRLTIEDVVKRRGEPGASKPVAAPAVPAKPASGRQAAARRAATEVINP